MTALSTGMISELLRIAELEGPIATVADEIRQEEGSIDDEALERLPWRALRPIIRASGEPIRAAMIRAACLGQLKEETTGDLEARVIAAGNRARKCDTPIRPGSTSDPQGPTREASSPDAIGRRAGMIRRFVR